ncbi:MAG TPA: hypothetical protein VK791_03455 [bacterium]|jgi:hypothetical protein|nr:hypothetical protein [bacterium]
MGSGRYWFILLIFVLLGCDRPALHPVAFHDLSKDHPALYSFAVWQNIEPAETYQLFQVDHGGKWKRLPGPYEKPIRSFSEIAMRLFYPEKATGQTDLNESKEIVSPDGYWAIKTYSIKTFADDLNNDTLVIRNTRSEQVEKVKVPSLSNGEMFPLFWNPRELLFYFMTSVGDDNGRSLELWEYDLNKKVFLNVGDTNGDAYMSPDGAWIVWETGPTFDPAASKELGHQVWLCAYDTTKKANYQLTRGLSVSFFQQWEKP